MNIQNETKTQSCRLLKWPGVLLFQEKSAIVAAAVMLISSSTLELLFCDFKKIIELILVVLY